MDQTTANGYCSLRSLMRAYWLARKSGKFEPRRLNRALGIAMRSKTVQYTVNTKNGFLQFMTPASDESKSQVFAANHCTCIDHKHRVWCKHKIAAALLTRARAIDQATGGQQSQQLPSECLTSSSAVVASPSSFDNLGPT